MRTYFLLKVKVMLMSGHHLGKGRGNGQKCAPARGHAVLINAISDKNDSIQKEKISAQLNRGDTETKKRESVDLFCLIRPQMLFWQ